MGAFADARWPEEIVEVASDELLVLYTDGVIDTPGRHERFGTDRLKALLTENAGNDPQSLLERLDAALDAFRSGPERDDVAVVALGRRP